jgi:hypothetical protein
MKKFTFFSAFILLFISVSAQTPSYVAAPGGGEKSVMIYIRDLTGKPMYGFNEISGVEGTPFLDKDEQIGTVRFKDGRMTKDVHLKFDMLNSKLYFVRDGVNLEFIDTVKDFYLQSVENNTLGAVYRSDFPPIDRNTSSTFYELLVDGKLSLLKHRYKVITEYREYSASTKKRYDERTQLYASLPGNRIIKIRKDRKFLMEAMPEYADKIKTITDKLKLKNDESLITLFEELNK